MTIHHFLKTRPSFDCPSWQSVTFTLEADEDYPERQWLVGHFPLGVCSKIALMRDEHTAKLFIEAIAFTQQIYRRKAEVIRERMKANEN